MHLKTGDGKYCVTAEDGQLNIHECAKDEGNPDFKGQQFVVERDVHELREEGTELCIGSTTDEPESKLVVMDCEKAGHWDIEDDGKFVRVRREGEGNLCVD